MRSNRTGSVYVSCIVSHFRKHPSALPYFIPRNGNGPGIGCIALARQAIGADCLRWTGRVCSSGYAFYLSQNRKQPDKLTTRLIQSSHADRWYTRSFLVCTLICWRTTSPLCRTAGICRASPLADNAHTLYLRAVALPSSAFPWSQEPSLS